MWHLPVRGFTTNENICCECRQTSILQVNNENCQGKSLCNGYRPYTIIYNGHCPILNYSVHIYRNTVAECTYLITNVHK